MEKIRILSNFGRMAVSFVIGLILVRQMLDTGPAAYALYVLMIAGVGFSTLAREFMRVALIAHLGAAHAAEEDAGGITGNTSHGIYPRALGEAGLLAGLLIGLGAAVLGTVALFLPQLGTGAADLDAARTFVALRGAHMLLEIAIYPALATLLAARRQFEMNLFLTLERVLELTALLLAGWLVAGEMQADEMQTGEMSVLIAFGALALGLYGAAALALAFGLMRRPAYRPRPGRASWRTLWGLRRMLAGALLDIGWPFLYFRFDVLLMSAVFGPAGTILFGLPAQLSGYLNQVSIGLVSGLEAIFARLTFGGAETDAETDTETDARQARKHSVLRAASTLQALSIFFLAAFLALTLPTLIGLWLGDRLDGTGTTAGELAVVVLLLLPGIGAISLTDHWRWLLTGAGALNSFVGPTVLVALINPVALTAWYTLADPPLETFILGVGLLYSGLNVAFHFLWIPRVVSRVFGVPTGALLRPFVLPLVLAILTYAAGLLVPGEGLAALPWQIGLFGAAFIASLVLLRRAG